jgi:hypothetical protein
MACRPPKKPTMYQIVRIMSHDFQLAIDVVNIHRSENKSATPLPEWRFN